MYLTNKIKETERQILDAREKLEQLNNKKKKRESFLYQWCSTSYGGIIFPLAFGTDEDGVDIVTKSYSFTSLREWVGEDEESGKVLAHEIKGLVPKKVYQQYLIQEAEKRGYKSGPLGGNYKCLHSPDVTFKSCDKIEYQSSMKRLVHKGKNGYNIIFERGKWAKIEDETLKYRGQDIEYVGSNTVSILGVRFHLEYLKHCLNLLNICSATWASGNLDNTLGGSNVRSKEYTKATCINFTPEITLGKDAIEVIIDFIIQKQ